jgi:competence protein ComEC
MLPYLLEEQDKVRMIEPNSILSIPGSAITVFAGEESTDDNEQSLCILFQPENCDILITGDRSEEGELALLEHTDLPDLEILGAGHHGSATSTSWELLNATRPEVVIISVGKDNRYGHPKQETLERLQSFGCGIYRTDLEGTIIFRG